MSAERPETAHPESAGIVGSGNGESGATTPPPPIPPPGSPDQPPPRRPAIVTPPDGTPPVHLASEPGGRPAHLAPAPAPGANANANAESGAHPPDPTLVGDPLPPPGPPGPYGGVGGLGGLGGPAPTRPKLGKGLLGRLPARPRLRMPKGRSDGAPVPDGRWVVHRVRHVHPGSVLRMAGLFYICMFLTVMVAGFLLWNVGRSTETIDQLEGFITDMGAYGRCVPEDSIEPGTDFERSDDCPDGRVSVGEFRFDDGTVFRTALFGGIVLVVAATIGTLLVTLLFNLLTEVTGGIRYTTVRENVRPPSRSPGPARRR